MREEQRLMIVENRMLRRTFGVKSDRTRGNCIMRKLTICTDHRVLFE
jgi:hypothetical protein